MDADQLWTFIRDIPDFPQPGVVFRDITPLLGDAGAFHDVVGRRPALREQMVAMVDALPSADCPPPSPGTWCPPHATEGR